MKRTFIFMMLFTVLCLISIGTSAEILEVWEDGKNYFLPEAEVITSKSTDPVPKSGEASSELDITMPDTIMVGESLTVTINNAEDFTWTERARLYDHEGTIGGVVVQNGTAFFPDYYFDVGDYTIQITGYDKETSQRVRVTMDLSVIGIPGGEGPTITSDKATADVQEMVSFTIQMSGAEKFAVRFANNDKDGFRRSSWYYRLVENLNQTVQSVSADIANSTLICYAKAYVNGSWTSETRYEVKINEAPKLDTPVVTVPLDVEVGKSFEIMVAAVEHAEQYIVEVGYNNNWFYYETYSEAGTYTIPAFSEPGEYIILVYASAAGYENSNNTWDTVNAVGELIEGPVLTSDKEEYKVNDEAVFTASLENAEQFKFRLYVYYPDGTYTYWSDQIIDAVDGEAAYYQTVYADYESGRLEMHVRALVNGVWTAETSLSVPIKSANRLPMPTLTVPESPHEAGVPVSIQIGEVEGAYWYNVNVYLYKDYWDYLFYRQYNEAGEQILDGLAEPGTYKIELSAYPKYDDDEFIVSKRVEATLVIAGSLADGPFVAADKLTVPIGSNIMIIASLKDAEKFYINTNIIEQDGNRWWSDFYRDSVDAYDDYGTFNIDIYNNYTDLIDKICVAKVSAFVNGKWTTASEIRIPITGQEQPAILSPDFVLPDDLKTIEASAFENIAATSVYFPDACTSIGPLAFASSKIQQIRLPQNCAVSDTAFENCSELTVIVALPGGTSETWARTYCNNHSNCQYVEGDLFQ